MAIATGSGPASRGSILRVLSLCAVLGLMLAAGARPARAGYDWCSVDPTIILRRAGSSLAHAMDIQVMVPRSVLPMAGTARLGVVTPSNVTGTEVLNTSLPKLFSLKTVFGQTQVAATGDAFRVGLSLRMPPTTQDYPVRLVVIDQDTRQAVAIKEGMASQVLTLAVNSADLHTLAGDVR